MKETILKFGPNKSLLAIVSNPDYPIENSPVAIMLNAGVINRVGPYQLHVDIARGLAEAGFRAVRMDMSSFGDSATRDDVDTHDEASLKDLQDAFDALADKYRANSFVLIGLCSGAYRAHVIAHADPRAVGLIAMDGITFQTPAVLKYGLFDRMLSRRNWRNQLKLLNYKRQGIRIRAPDKPNFWRAHTKLFLSRMLKRLCSGKSRVDFAEAALLTDDLDRQVVVKEQEAMLNRGAQMLYIFSGGLASFTNPSQFAEMFDRPANESNFQLSIHPNANHTFMLVEDRKALVNQITAWYHERFNFRI